MCVTCVMHRWDSVMIMVMGVHASDTGLVENRPWSNVAIAPARV